MFFEKSSFTVFLQYFTVFFTVFEINADFLIFQQTKYLYTRHPTPILHFKKKKLHSPFQKHPLFTKYINLLVIYLNINIFTKKISSFCKRFSKDSLFTTFSLFLKVSEVCNISNKCWLPNKSANKIFLHKTPYIPPSFQKKIVLSIAHTFRNIHFLPHI